MIVCDLVVMATIRDFEIAHPDFEEGATICPSPVEPGHGASLIRRAEHRVSQTEGENARPRKPSSNTNGHSHTFSTDRYGSAFSPRPPGYQ